MGTQVRINQVQGLESELASKQGVLSRKSALIIETDFYNTTSPFAQGLTATAISAGSLNGINGEPNHPGIVDLRDSTTANGGFLVQTAANAFRLGGSEKCVITFQVRTNRTTANGWLGFKDNTTNAQPVDGVYVYWVGNGTNATLTARTRNNNVETIGANSYNLALNTWVTLIIEMNSNASSALFTLFDDNGSELWTQTITTNIPTAAGRETGFGIQANESTTDAAAVMMYLDYARCEINRTLVR